LKIGWLIKIYNDLEKDFPIIFMYKENKKRGLEQTRYNILGEKSTAIQRDGA
jgi:hypothetical protein